MSQKNLSHNGETKRVSVSRRIGTVALVVLALNVFALVLLVVGLFANWFHVAVAQGDVPGQTQIRFIINTAEVTEDAKELVEETQQASETVETVAELSSAEGRVVKNAPGANKLVVSEEQGGEVSVTVNEVTEVEMDGGQGQLSNIKTGDQVHVVYREKGGENFAIKIQRLAKKGNPQSGD